nr:MAG TPA: hypothetical protein [Caudoviricetes sp.]
MAGEQGIAPCPEVLETSVLTFDTTLLLLRFLKTSPIFGTGLRIVFVFSRPL